MIPRGADDIRMIRAFDMDEWKCGEVMIEMHEGDVIFPSDFYNYQSVYFYLSYAAFVLKQILIPYPDLFREMVLSMRGVSYLMGILNLVMMVRMLRELGVTSKLLKTLAVLGIAGIENYAYYCYHAHPDTTQVFFLIMGFFFHLRHLKNDNPADAVWSGLALGLAAGTKYAGLFAIPFVLAGTMIHEKRRVGTIAALRAGGILIAAFIIGHLGSNPHWILLPAESWKSLVGVPGSNFGTGKRDVFLVWLRHLREVGWGTLSASLIWFASILRSFRRDRRSFETLFQLVLSGWVLFFFSFVLFTMKTNQGVRHLFPAIPFLALGVCWGLHELMKTRSRLGLSLVAVIVLLNLPALAQFQRHSEFLFPEEAARVRVGRELERSAAPTARILYPWYSYVPPRFVEAYSFHPAIYLDVTEQGLRKAGIDIVVLRTTGEDLAVSQLLEKGGLFPIRKGIGSFRIYAAEGAFHANE